MKRTPLRRMSKHRRSEMPQRRLVRVEVLLRDKVCQAKELVNELKCFGDLEVHELLPRSQGGDYLNSKEAIAVCGVHHQFIHSHPKRAYELGLLKHKWD